MTINFGEFSFTKDEVVKFTEIIKYQIGEIVTLGIDTISIEITWDKRVIYIFKIADATVIMNNDLTQEEREESVTSIFVNKKTKITHVDTFINVLNKLKNDTYNSN